MQTQIIINILLITSSIVGLITSCFVYLADKKSLLNRLLATIIILAVFWALSIFATIKTSSINIGSVSFFAALWILVLVNLVLMTLNLKFNLKNSIKIIIVGILSSVLTIIPTLLVRQIDTTQGYIKVVEFGPAYFIYVLFILLLIILFIYNSYHAIKITTGVKRLQSLYIIVGFILTSIFGLIFTVILPLLGFFNLDTLGPILMIFTIAGAAYAATKHYIYDYQVVLSELWVFLLITVGLIWLTISLSTFNIIFFLLLFSICALFIKSTISEAAKKKLLEEDKKNLQKLDKMKDDFQQMTEHELNTPISLIEGKLSVILDENFTDFSEKQKKYLQPVFDDAKRLAQLSHELVYISEINQEEIKLFLENTDITDLIKDVVEQNQTFVTDKGLKIEVKLQENLQKINIDRDKIKIVLINLIQNAIKFTSKGLITIGTKIEKTELVISISDTGIGIKIEDQEKIFSKFFQSDRFGDTPIEQQGTGLSLYISKKLIELHNGRIKVDSKLGIGATFSLYLPLNLKK